MCSQPAHPEASSRVHVVARAVVGSAAALTLGRLGADGIVHGRDAAAGEAMLEELHAIGADGAFIAADG